MFYDFQAFFVLAAADMIVHKMCTVIAFPIINVLYANKMATKRFSLLSDANISIFQALNNIIEL